MPGLKSCFQRAARFGIITAEEAKELAQRFDDIVDEAVDMAAARDQMAMELEAEAEHRRRVALLMEAKWQDVNDKLSRYRNYRNESDKLEALQVMLEAFGRNGTNLDSVEVKREVIIRMAQGEMSLAMYELRRGAFTGDRRRQGGWVGSRKVRARSANIVRELFGEATDDKIAATIAKSFHKVAEDLRKRFNDAGGAIAKLDGWGLPQHHDAEALLNYGKENWVNRMMEDGVLDRERTVHALTKRPMTDAELRTALRVIWDKITTDGAFDRDPRAYRGRPALYKQHADHRFLHFKNADAWMAYSKEFGRPDILEAMIGHIGSMARDIAFMEVFGPNPHLMFTYIKNQIEIDASSLKSNRVIIDEQTARLKELQKKLTKPDPDYEKLADRMGEIHKELDKIRRTYAPQFGGKPARKTAQRIESLNKELAEIHKKIQPYWSGDEPLTIADHAIQTEIEEILADMQDPIRLVDHKRPQKARDYTAKMLAKADAMWDNMRGRPPIDTAWAKRMSAARNVVSSSALGGAFISALTDAAASQDVLLRFGAGMRKAGVHKIVPVILKDMIGKGLREDAVASGLGLDSSIHVLQQSARYAGDIDMKGWTGYITDRTLTYSGLIPWTQSAKHFVGLGLMHSMANLSDTAFGDLPKALQREFTVYGIAPIWDKIRTVEQYEPRPGVKYLRPNEIEAQIGREAAEVYLGAILRATREGVPEPTIESTSIVTSQPPGTLIGELIRTGGQFKGFAFAVGFLHLRRTYQNIAGRQPNAVRNAAALFITSTILGLFVLALKDIKAGRDPRKWLDEDTYLDPKIWGAAILQSGGLGIYGDFIFSDVNRFGGGLQETMAGPLVGRGVTILGASQALATGDMKMAKRKGVRALTENMPKIWQLDLLFRRQVAEQLQILADPRARAAFRRDMTRRRREYGQEYWWPRGRKSPKRAPDISRVLATR